MMEVSKGITEVLNRVAYSCSAEKLCDVIDAKDDELAMKMIPYCKNINGNVIFSPLGSAVQRNNLTVINALLDAKASPESEIQVIGIRPLSYAISLRNYEAATLLSDRAANVRIHDRFGPGMVAKAIYSITDSDQDARKEKVFIRMLRSLIKNGADVNEADAEKTTPLLHVISNNYPNKGFMLDVAKELVYGGADISREAIDIARLNGNVNMTQFLKIEKARQARRALYAEGKTSRMQKARL